MALLMAFLKNAFMCMKKVKLINHDCLPILMLLYIILNIMLVYLMLLAALSNAVCLHNASFLLPLIFSNAFCFHALSWFTDTWLVYFKYYFASYTMLLACWIFRILCSHRFFSMKGLCALLRNSTENKHYYYYNYYLFAI